MKNLIILILFAAIPFHAIQACNIATTNLFSETDNMDGTYTYNIGVCIEFNGLEGAPDWFQIQFTGGTSSGIVAFTPSTVTTTGGDDYDGSLAMGGTAVRWQASGFLPGGDDLFCNVFDITVMGKPTQLDVNYHDTYPSNDCYYSQEIDFNNPPACVDELIVSDNPASGEYEAKISVTSQGVVPTSTVTPTVFHAGNYVELTQDFCVPVGADFEAYIEGCN